jgi:ribosomal protein S20
MKTKIKHKPKNYNANEKPTLRTFYKNVQFEFNQNDETNIVGNFMAFL